MAKKPTLRELFDLWRKSQRADTTKQYRTRTELPAELRGLRKVCPNCETEKGAEEFGPRRIKGKLALQSYCRACRSEHSKTARLVPDKDV